MRDEWYLGEEGGTAALPDSESWRPSGEAMPWSAKTPPQANTSPFKPANALWRCVYSGFTLGGQRASLPLPASARAFYGAPGNEGVSSSPPQHSIIIALRAARLLMPYARRITSRILLLSPSVTPLLNPVSL